MTAHSQKRTKIAEMFMHGYNLDEVLRAGTVNKWTLSDVKKVVNDKGWKLTEAGRLMLRPVRSPVARAMTVREVAEELHVSKMTVYRLIETGQLGYLQVGRSKRIPIEAYEKFRDKAFNEAAS